MKLSTLLLFFRQAEVAQYKHRCEALEKENSELRKLVGGDRTPKYLPISPAKSHSGQRHVTYTQ